ncbi:uncharacterized protein JCM10292_007293 [Rhodotorula paludigena]|uniref:uncharacterized protein n=1 Tax=Rhodotorula paludigena TaxID=86838 RepID=UPI00317CE334
MFTSFNEGDAEHPRDWNEAPAYLPGRFHAHARPAAPSAPSGSRASSVHRLAFAPLSPTTSSFPSRAASPPPGQAPHTRTRPLGRALLALSPTRARRAEAERENEERSTLLGGWIGGATARGVQQVLAAAAEADEAAAEEEEEPDKGLLRPGRRKVERWMRTWWRRWAILVGAPCLIIWLWCSVPFPVSDPYKEEPPWHIPWPPTTDPPGSLLHDLLTRIGWLQHAHHGNATALQPVSPGPIARTGPDLVLPRSFSVELGFVEQPPNAGDGPAPDAPDDDLPVDANFWYFLLFYYGIYLAIALIFVTKLFDLYRLNWWPAALGGTASYVFFWLLSLSVGFLLHHFDLDGFGRRTRSHRPEAQEWDWERKTTWVLLAFATMALPALACFTKLRADRRNSYRRSLTPAQKTFLERQLSQRMPRSYRRFLWFLGNLALTLLALIVGQAFATVYLSTLPHSNIEGLVYVWTWIITVNLLNAVSNWILQRKIRSQALVFVFRFYFFLVYYVFYRNLFARLRSPDQAAYITLLSSSFVVLWYPLSMSKTFWRVLRWTVGMDLDWQEYAEQKGQELYLRNLSENVTMIAFLGWLSILHWGSNRQVYPFFAFDDPYDPYTYRLTLTASLVIYAAELVSSWLARLVCWICYSIDVTNLGLDQFRAHPELVVACVFTSCHVLSDMLLFLVKLNFR